MNSEMHVYLLSHNFFFLSHEARDLPATLPTAALRPYSSEAETIDRLYVNRVSVKAFWHDIHSWNSLTIDNVPPFNFTDTIYFTVHLDTSVSDSINLIITSGKCHMLTCRRKEDSSLFASDY